MMALFHDMHGMDRGRWEAPPEAKEIEYAERVKGEILEYKRGEVATSMANEKGTAKEL